jgi:hypothetical protein
MVRKRDTAVFARLYFPFAGGLPMRKFVPIFAVLALTLASVPGRCQDTAAIQSFFSGKQVVIKIDMPGSQKGVDLRFNKPSPMDWKEYGGRCKQFGVAIRQGDVARVTSIVFKKDMMEFQLDGGGFGTAGDDTNTTVVAKVVDKRDLENQIANTDDPDKKADLQRQLDRERARRERQNAINQQQADYASRQKAQQVAQNRVNGGSRFNLRWSGSVPADLSPQMLMQLLQPYVNFDAVAPTPSGVAVPSAGPPPEQGAPPAGDDANVPATAKLHRGMKIEEVTSLFGPGKQISESVGDNGLKTSVYAYTTSDRHVEVTYVEGLVVRYTISSN